MANFSLGQLMNIVRYHFGRNSYKDEENNNGEKGLVVC